MPVPLNNLTKAHVDQLAGLPEPLDAGGPEEIERRAQRILNEWQKLYFTGAPFTGVDGPHTFEECEILWDHAVPERPGRLPILHSVLADRRDGDPERGGDGLWIVRGEWTFNTFVRTHPQLPAGAAATGPVADSARRTAFHQARRVGDQFAWLLRGPHTQELAFKGITRVKLVNGPRPLQSGAWFLRQLVWSAAVIFRTSGNDP